MEVRGYLYDGRVTIRMKRGVTCTKQNPDRDAQFHPDSEELGDQVSEWPGGDIQYYKCPNCGSVFREELPQ